MWRNHNDAKEEEVGVQNATQAVRSVLDKAADLVSPKPGSVYAGIGVRKLLLLSDLPLLA